MVFIAIDLRDKMVKIIILHGGAFCLYDDAVEADDFTAATAITLIIILIDKILNIAPKNLIINLSHILHHYFH